MLKRTLAATSDDATVAVTVETTTLHHPFISCTRREHTVQVDETSTLTSAYMHCQDLDTATTLPQLPPALLDTYQSTVMSYTSLLNSFLITPLSHISVSRNSKLNAYRSLMAELTYSAFLTTKYNLQLASYKDISSLMDTEIQNFFKITSYSARHDHELVAPGMLVVYMTNSPGTIKLSRTHGSITFPEHATPIQKRLATYSLNLVRDLSSKLTESLLVSHSIDSNACLNAPPTADAFERGCTSAAAQHNYGHCLQEYTYMSYTICFHVTLPATTVRTYFQLASYAIEKMVSVARQVKTAYTTSPDAVLSVFAKYNYISDDHDLFSALINQYVADLEKYGTPAPSDLAADEGIVLNFDDDIMPSTYEGITPIDGSLSGCFGFILNARLIINGNTDYSTVIECKSAGYHNCLTVTIAHELVHCLYHSVDATMDRTLVYGLDLCHKYRDYVASLNENRYEELYEVSPDCWVLSFFNYLYPDYFQIT